MATNWPTSTGTTCGRPSAEPPHHRQSVDEEATVDLFCPVPQMVGGGTVHWQGWLPIYPEDFRLHSIVGDLQGTSLADWPISYDELEPYYTKVEWAFGVSGLAGANAYEGPRSKGYPARRCRCPGMRRSSTKAPGRWVGTLSRHRRPRCPVLTRPSSHGDQRIRAAAR